MTLSSEDLVSAIAKLNDLTRREQIRWSPRRREKEGASPIKLSYSADYEGRTLCITEFDAPRVSSKWAQVMYDHPSRERHRLGAQPRYTLEIVDTEGDAIYEFPNVQGIADLFASVRAQIIDVEGLIKSLLTTP